MIQPDLVTRHPLKSLYPRFAIGLMGVVNPHHPSEVSGSRLDLVKDQIGAISVTN